MSYYISSNICYRSSEAKLCHFSLDINVTCLCFSLIRQCVYVKLVLGMISAFLLLTYLNHNTMYIQTSVLYANNEDSLSYFILDFI